MVNPDRDIVASSIQNRAEGHCEPVGGPQSSVQLKYHSISIFTKRDDRFLIRCSAHVTEGIARTRPYEVNRRDGEAAIAEGKGAFDP